MPKNVRIAKLAIGSISLNSAPHEQYGGEHHGELNFRLGANKLSAGLIKLNKKKTKGKIFWDRNLDYIIGGKENKVGSIKLERSQASELWDVVGGFSAQAMVDIVTGKGSIELPSIYLYNPLNTFNKNGYRAARIKINNKEFLQYATRIKILTLLVLRESSNF